ncbi:MAG: hypothetical protein JRN62_01720 [Nitrososphaerota archaeon]|nr:hypothetical protein [Nitrososphaerota archaeon]
MSAREDHLAYGDNVDNPRDVNPRDVEVLRTIEDERLVAFTFDGLRRITRVHPETLSRALERLEENGMIVRSPGGYSLAERTRETLSFKSAGDTSKSISILHTFLPYPASAGKIAESLKGRWFDNARWVGMAEVEDGFVMKWVTDDGTALIDAKFSLGQLDIEAKISHDSDLPKAVRAAHQLVARISRLYSTKPGSRTAFMRGGYIAPTAM